MEAGGSKAAMASRLCRGGSTLEGIAEGWSPGPRTVSICRALAGSSRDEEEEAGGSKAA